MEKDNYTFQIQSDKMNSNLRLVALKIVMVQKQFTQNYFSCAVIKYERLSKAVSEYELT